MIDMIKGKINFYSTVPRVIQWWLNNMFKAYNKVPGLYLVGIIPQKALGLALSSKTVLTLEPYWPSIKVQVPVEDKVKWLQSFGELRHLELQSVRLDAPAIVDDGFCRLSKSTNVHFLKYFDWPSVIHSAVHFLRTTPHDVLAEESVVG